MFQQQRANNRMFEAPFARRKLVNVVAGPSVAKVLTDGSQPVDDFGEPWLVDSQAGLGSELREESSAVGLPID